ncbi:MAG: hypothetical protein BA871_08655 [Desulfuromonadales bacterium C00003096]|jgi:hypothetical protein|nr:MAG: hypothetical protein BA871_08655 [Desulfuromonadales bacterium C00003096]
MKFEYTTSYLSVDYKDGKGNVLQRVPVYEKFINSQEYLNLMNEMGEEGWELISVQAVLKGIYNHNTEFSWMGAGGGGAGYGFGYSITDGFMLFWKKQY